MGSPKRSGRAKSSSSRRTKSLASSVVGSRAKKRPKSSGNGISTPENTHSALLPVNVPFVVLDNGGWTVKHGVVVSDGGTKDAASSVDALNSTLRVQQQSQQPLVAPNATARLKHQIAVLVSDEIESSVKNKGQLNMTRPLERGYCVDLGTQLQVWRRILHLNGIMFDDASQGVGVTKGKKRPRIRVGRGTAPSPPVPAGGASVSDTQLRATLCGCLILTQPFTPTCVLESTDEVLFRDLGFGLVGKVLVQSMAAYRYIHDRPPGSKESSSVPESVESEMHRFDDQCFSTDGADCCCVVDSGFSVTHIVPTVAARAVERGIRRINVGGKLLTNHLKEIVTYRQWNMMDEFPIVNEAKEKLCYVSQSFERDLKDAARNKDERVQPFDRDFVLPDFVDTFEGEVQKPLALLRKEREKAASATGTVFPVANAAHEDRGGVTDAGNSVEDNSLMAPKCDEDEDEDKFDSDEEETDEQRFLRIQRLKDQERRRKELMEQERQVLSLSTERFSVPEVLFRPTDVGLEQVGIPEAIVQAVQSCDPCVRAAMYRNVLLVGGNTKIPGYPERVEVELRSLAPSNYAVRVSVPRDPLKYAWRGASEFVKRRDFVSQFCVTKADWEKDMKNGGGGPFICAGKDLRCEEEGLTFL